MATHRQRKYGLSPEEEPGLEMSSLIDVSFLLLIYFLVTSSLDPKEADLGLRLPTQTAASNPVKLEQMTIQVTAEGHVVVNKETLDTDVEKRDLPILLDRLKDYKQSADLIGSDPIVVIAADDGSRGQRFVDVLNALAAVGITNVTITGFVES